MPPPAVAAKSDAKTPAESALPASPQANAPTAISAEALDASKNVFFARGVTSVSTEGRETLAELARKLKADYRLKLVLAGHADESGSTEYCVAVAAKRASAVKTELQKLGVSGRQIRRRSPGCEPPARDACVSIACDRVRRRVELQLLEPESLRAVSPRPKP